MNASRMVSLVAGLAVTTSACSGYVADTSIAPGDRVRVTAPSLELDKGVGTVAALETDTLVVNTEERADALALPLSRVEKLEVHRGTKSRFGRGLLIGLAVGAGAGAALGAVAASSGPCIDDPDPCPEFGALFGGIFGAAGGLVLGGVIGAATKTDRWETVPLEDIRVGLSPVTPDGVAVLVALRFR